MSLGAYLRSLREAKGGSLEDMARSTRVGIRHLEALEDERLADLEPDFPRPRQTSLGRKGAGSVAVCSRARMKELSRIPDTRARP